MILFLLSLIPFFLYLTLRSKKWLQMLQQNWYNDDNRYFKWLLKNINKLLFGDILFILFYFLKFISFELSIILFGLFYLINYFVYKNFIKKEQTKKPLVITKRIIRLYITMFILYGITIIEIILTFGYNHINIYYLYLGLLLVLNPFIIMLANILNKPIEKLIFFHYKTKASKKLLGINNLKRVAITGSYGKTSCKNILNEILNVKYNAFATEKSFNTMNGLMISINNKLDKFTDVFIAEMGAFKRGEIKEKSKFIKPQYGILTTIGEAHLESFHTKENIQSAKFELIDSLKDDGVAILNMDDPYQTSYHIKSKCKVLWFSLKNKKADIYASDIKLSNKGTTFTCNIKDIKKSKTFETKLLGKENVYNIMAAIILAYELGLTLDEISLGVKRVKPITHRLELKKYGNITIIDDSYNSNPVGSKMALDVLKMMPGKKIIITPGMIELGTKEDEYNMKFGEYIASTSDEVILVGDKQTKAILKGLQNKKYPTNKIYILNDIKEAFILIKKLSDDHTFVLLENDLPDLFNE